MKVSHPHNTQDEHFATTSDLTIARQANLKNIEDIANLLNVPAHALYRYGPYKAKIDPAFLNSNMNTNPKLPAPHEATHQGKLILVTAINPTPAGEGKTTTTIGLADAMQKLGHKAAVCLREPSLGPCFGLKGGATGGGQAQIAPMDEINLHFTGDFHAITTANNLLAAMIDNHIHYGNKLGLDPAQIYFKRAMDMNDRALRKIIVGLGQNSQLREDGFDITVATEIMAIFCLSRTHEELTKRCGNIYIGKNYSGEPVYAREIGIENALAALLKDAFNPNLVQTLEGTPAFVHGGPFANIAHGCNSLRATELALNLADYVVTEAGFGADLGAEKFFNIKCRQSNLKPAAAVIVATVRALKMHGGCRKESLTAENTIAVSNGVKNLIRHIENVQKFNIPVIVALNHFTTDTHAETEIVLRACLDMGVPAHLCRHWAEGGTGALSLAKEVVAATAKETSDFQPLYHDDIPLTEKINIIAKQLYRASEVTFSETALAKLHSYEVNGYGKFPICMAKTPYSFSADPKAHGTPEHFTLPVNDVKLAAGAGFVIAYCGDVITMPGLPREPAAMHIYLNNHNEIEGLF